MKRTWMAFPLLLVLLLAAQCGGTARGGDPLTNPPEEPVRVTVQNNGFYEATIYLLRGAERRRLGTVNGASSATFTLQRHLVTGVTDLRFLVDYLGRRGGTPSETIIAQPGDEIKLVIR